MLAYYMIINDTAAVLLHSLQYVHQQQATNSDPLHAQATTA